MENQLLDGFLLQERRIEPLTGTVRGGGVETHLPSKSIEVLLCLARNPRRLVSREALLEKVWGNANASQESLSRTISEIRQALGDSADHPAFIQTVPKRGYRLLVEPLLSAGDQQQVFVDKRKRSGLIGNLMDRGVIQAGAVFLVVGWLLIQVADAVVPIIGLPEWTRPFVTYVVIAGFPIVIVFAWFFEYAEGRFYLDKGRDSPTLTTGLERNYLTMVAAYVIAALGALVYQYSVGFDVPRDQPGGSTEIVATEIEVEPNSIAVLRFMNIDGSDKTEIFSYGFAEDVLDRLARVPGLLVSARGDSWSLDPNSSSAEVRRRLRVAYYLEGSIQTVGDEIRVVAQLIDSETGFHIVSKSVNKRIENYFEAQNEITNLVVASLRVALPEDTQMQLAGNYEGLDVDAYILYRQGREVLERPLTQETLAEATEYYERALEIDPEYAAAHAGLCAANTDGFALTADNAYISKAELACAAGLAANSNLHMVYEALGDLYSQTGRHSEAESAYSQAITINNQDVAAMQGLASIYERQQKFEEAVDLLGQAIRLQPGNWRSIDSLGDLLFNNGRYTEAASAYSQVVLLDPENSQGQGNLGSALLMVGDFYRAEDALEKSLEIEPDRTFFSNLAIIYYYQGRFGESAEIHRLGIAESPDHSSVWLNLGDALHFSGEAEAARHAFARCVELAEAALKVNPRNTAVMYELAWASVMLGDSGRGRELINRSNSLDPDDPYVHYYDGLLKHREGQDRAAIGALKTAVELGYPKVLLAAEPYLKELDGQDDFVKLVLIND